SGFKLLLHLQQRARPAARARSPDRRVAVRFQDARDVLAIETAAGHHRDLPSLPLEAGGDQTAMPEREDARRGVTARRSSLFGGDGVTQRGAEDTNQQVACPGDQPEQEPLPARESCLGRWLVSGLRGGGRGGFHLSIVT